MSCDTNGFLSYGVVITEDDFTDPDTFDSLIPALVKSFGLELDDTDGGPKDEAVMRCLREKFDGRNGQLGVENFGSYASPGWVFGVTLVYVDGDGQSYAEVPLSALKRVETLRKNKQLRATFAKLRKALPGVHAPRLIAGVMLREGERSS